jgi:hypothetical protein
VAKIKETLGLDWELIPPTAIEKANEMMSLKPTGTLLAQVEASPPSNPHRT